MEAQRSKQSSLRSSVLSGVRKQHAKIMKKPIAPLPKTPPKIYKVEPRNFMEVVQKLTGAPENQLSWCPKEVAPPPLDLASATRAAQQPQPLPVANDSQTSANVDELMNDTAKKNSRKVTDPFRGLSPLGFNFSPSSHPWLSSLLLSPGTQSFEEASL